MSLTIDGAGMVVCAEDESHCVDLFLVSRLPEWEATCSVCPTQPLTPLADLLIADTGEISKLAAMFENAS